jgi:hypothetical protein
MGLWRGGGTGRFDLAMGWREDLRCLGCLIVDCSEWWWWLFRESFVRHFVESMVRLYIRFTLLCDER